MKKKRITRSVWRIALLVLLALAVGLGVYSFNVRTFKGTRLPMPFGVGAAVVISGSMEPKLSVGELVIVVAADSYELGDFVVYETGNALVVHEIIRFEADGRIVTKGAANNTEDDPILEENVCGRVVFSVPYVGYLLDLVRSLPGTLLIIGLSLWLYIRSWQGERREDEEKRREVLREIKRLREEQDTKDTEDQS